MTLDEAKAFFRHVESAANDGDDEAAHAREDDFHRAVLQHVAEHPRGQHNAEMARLALRTRYLQFARWYA